MLTIQLVMPRDDEKRVVDILHLNNIRCTVQRPEDRPVIVTLELREELFEDEPARATATGSRLVLA